MAEPGILNDEDKNGVRVNKNNYQLLSLGKKYHNIFFFF